MKCTYFFIPIVLLFVFSSCTRSLVYNPAMMLPHQPLKEKEIDIQAGVGMLPETRKDVYEDRKATLGIQGHLSYGFTPSFSMTLKGWADLQNQENVFRSGYSLMGQFVHQLNSQERLYFVPEMGLALGGRDIDGYGVRISTIYHNSFSGSIAGYGGLGFMFGFKDFEETTNNNNERKLPVGYGVTGTLGFVWKYSKEIRLNCELAPIFQMNTFDDTNYFLVSPTIGIAYTIP